MPTAIITGASRGLGLALARALAARGWRLVIDARGARPLERRRARARPARPRSSRSPATSPTPGTARALVDAAGDAHRPARQQRERARPEPAAARSPTTRSTSSSASTASTCSRRWRWSSSRCRGCAAAARIVNVTSDAAVEAYEGWGGYGSSKAALEQLTAILGRRAPRPARLRGRPRRHAHPDAPGGLPGRGHLRPPAARGERARVARADRGRRCRAAATGRASRRCAASRRRERRARRSSCPTRAGGARAAGGARPRARRGAPAGRDARRRRSRTRASATCPAPARPATCSSSTRRRRSRRRSTRAPDGERVAVHLSTPLPGAPDDGADALARRAAHRRRRAAAAAPRRRAPRAARRRRSRAARTVRWAAPAAGSRGSTRPSRCTLPRPPRPADPLRLRPGAWPLADYQTVFATEPGSAEMPSAGRPFTPRLITRAGGRAACGVAPSAAHRRLLARARRARPTPSATRSRRRPPRSSTPPALRRAVIAVGTTVVRALETVAGRDGTRQAARAGPTSSITPERGAARGRRPDHRLARARGVAPAAARGGRRRATLERSYRDALATATCWHEFGDSHLILPLTYSPVGRSGVRSSGSASSISLVKMRSERL